MNRDEKAAVIDEIATQIGEAEAIFAVDYRGITVTQAAELRGRLRDADATFRVVKNSLTERAADQAGAESLKELLEGPTAFTFVRGDAAVAAKALSDFARAHDSFGFKGGRMGAEVLTIEQITSIARLPAREVLHAQLVGTIAAPITGLVRGLNALIAGIAIQLRQIADQMPAWRRQKQKQRLLRLRRQRQRPRQRQRQRPRQRHEAEAPDRGRGAELARRRGARRGGARRGGITRMRPRPRPRRPRRRLRQQEDDNEADASAQADDDTSAEAAKED